MVIMKIINRIMIITMMPMMLLKMTRIRGMIIDANGIEKLINIKSTPDPCLDGYIPLCYNISR